VAATCRPGVADANSGGDVEVFAMSASSEAHLNEALAELAATRLELSEAKEDLTEARAAHAEAEQQLSQVASERTAAEQSVLEVFAEKEAAQEQLDQAQASQEETEVRLQEASAALEEARARIEGLVDPSALAAAQAELEAAEQVAAEATAARALAMELVAAAIRRRQNVEAELTVAKERQRTLEERLAQVTLTLSSVREALWAQSAAQNATQGALASARLELLEEIEKYNAESRAHALTRASLDAERSAHEETRDRSQLVLAGVGGGLGLMVVLLAATAAYQRKRRSTTPVQVINPGTFVVGEPVDLEGLNSAGAHKGRAATQKDTIVEDVIEAYKMANKAAAPSPPRRDSGVRPPTSPEGGSGVTCRAPCVPRSSPRDEVAVAAAPAAVALPGSTRAAAPPRSPAAVELRRQEGSTRAAAPPRSPAAADLRRQEAAAVPRRSPTASAAATLPEAAAVPRRSSTASAAATLPEAAALPRRSPSASAVATLPRSPSKASTSSNPRRAQSVGGGPRQRTALR